MDKTLRKANSIFLILIRILYHCLLKKRVKIRKSMSDFLQRYGQWGMVAGAAEGIGAAFCEALAARGMNIILVDVNEKGMESLAKTLSDKFPVQVKPLCIDLSLEDAAGKCMSAMQGLDCRLMVYNAAYSRVKPFFSAETEELDLYINVNTRTPLHLVHLFSSRLKSERKTGGIILMSSLAGLWGTGLVAIYSGTKAFNLGLAEALSHELKPYGIDVSAVCAGATATPGYLGTQPAKGVLSPPLMRPAGVAAIALRKIGKKTVILPGLSNRMNYFLLTRLLPRSISVSLVNKMMRRTYRNI